MLRPLIRPIVRPLVRGVTEPGYGSCNAFSAVKKAIRDDAADVNILVIGDSTSDATDEWPYLFADWLGEQYPTHSVSYRLWDNTSNVYGTAVTVSTGSGAQTIRLWNASVGGTIPASLMPAAKYTGAVAALSPDVVVWNHGHNLAVSGDPAFLLSMDSAYSPWMEKVQATHPSAAQVVIAQNPRRDDDKYAAVYAMQQAIVRDKPRTLLVDVYSRFVAQGKAASLYSDDVHPSAAGQALYLAGVQSAWRSASPTTIAAPDAWLATAGTNLLLNGDFSAFDGAVPTNWTQTGAAYYTLSKELVTVDGSDAWSVKVEQTGATAQGGLIQALGAGALASVKGGTISFGLRRYKVASSDPCVGDVLVVVNGTGGANRKFYSPNTRVEGEWHWMFIRAIPVPSDATSVTFYLYTSTTKTIGATAYFARAICVAGNVPRDMA